MNNDSTSTATIGILGCGWLGLPLAKSLLKKGHSVKGTTTSAAKLPVLDAEGIAAYEIKVTPEGVSGDVVDFLAEVEILIIDIPPGLRKDPDLKFSEGIRKLSEAISKAGIKKILFVSSISVYSETESFTIYTEDTAPNAGSKAGKELIFAENILQENDRFETTILRFGGLLGAGRHPVKFLAGRKDLPNPLGPVNLIHQKDCIGIIESILKKGFFGSVLNAVYPLNPPREKYYQERARERGLEEPDFDHSGTSVGKIISASKVMRELDYVFVEEI